MPKNVGRLRGKNQVVEDMLCMYVMNMPKKLEDYLHLVEFAYNNNYQT